VTGSALKSGLDGVVAAETRISGVDGEAGELMIAGFPVEAIAPRATFEEMVFLLWNDALPSRDELGAFSRGLASHRDLPDTAIAVLRAAAAEGVPVMDALLTAAGTLRLGAGCAGSINDPAQGPTAERPPDADASAEPFFVRIGNGAR